MNPVFRYPRYNSIFKFNILDEEIVGSRGHNEISVKSIVNKPMILAGNSRLMVKELTEKLIRKRVLVMTSS